MLFQIRFFRRLLRNFPTSILSLTKTRYYISQQKFSIGLKGNVVDFQGSNLTIKSISGGVFKNFEAGIVHHTVESTPAISRHPPYKTAQYHGS